MSAIILLCVALISCGAFALRAAQKRAVRGYEDDAGFSIADESPLHRAPGAGASGVALQPWNGGLLPHDETEHTLHGT